MEHLVTILVNGQPMEATIRLGDDTPMDGETVREDDETGMLNTGNAKTAGGAPDGP